MTRHGWLLCAVTAAIAAVGGCSDELLLQSLHAPEWVSAQSIAGGVEVDFRPVDGAESYVAYYAIGDQQPAQGALGGWRRVPVSAPPAHIEGNELAEDEPWSFVVASVRGERESKPSAHVTAAARNRDLYDGPTWTVTTSGAGSYSFGFAVATGDVDGDGYDDVVVGAPGAAPGGEIRLYLGSPSGPATTPSWSFVEPNSGAALGASLSIADVGGDGRAEILAGMPSHHSGGLETGGARLWRGQMLGPPALAWQTTGSIDLQDLGITVALTADANGDGIGDIALSQQDGVRLYSGANPSSFQFVDSNSTADQYPPRQLAVASGNFDDDAYADIVIGMPSFDPPGAGDGGRCWLHRGTVTGPDPAIAWQADGNVAGGGFGGAFATGDYDGDGRVDLAASAPVMINGVTDEPGQVRLYLSTAGVLTQLAEQTISASAESQIGFALATRKADVASHDGLFVGRPRIFISSTAGEVSFYDDPLSSRPPSATLHGVPGSSFGAALASGDVNGDGFADLIVGAPSENGSGVVHGFLAVVQYGPVVDVGTLLVSSSGDARPIGATFHDPAKRQLHSCSWDFGDGDGFTPPVPCTPQTAGDIVPHHYVQHGKTFFVRLHVESTTDGRTGESAVPVGVR